MSRQLKRQFLVLHVGQARYAVLADRVREIVHMASLASSPGQPSLLAGFLDLRGEAVPVIRLRRLFRLDHRDPQMYTPLIVLDLADMTAALEADSVEEVVEIDEADLRPLGAGHSSNDCAEAVFNWNGQDVITLSCDLLLLAKERECVGELQSAMQQRIGELGSLAE
jgi:purine-binding chemotaxis protein CheW